MAPRFATDRRTLIKYAAFVVVYVVAAKVGFRAALVAEQVSPVWPPTGLSLWAVLYFGPRVWPVVWFSAAIVNTTTHVPLLAACTIAAGNALDLYAAATRQTIYQAALELCARLGHAVPWLQRSRPLPAEETPMSGP